MTTETVLLDANVLIALSFADHQHHRHATQWLGEARTFATTPSVQGALVRFAIRVATPTHAIDLIELLAGHPRHQFWADEAPFSRHLMRGIIGHRQVTDAYLAEAAASRGSKLATFDHGLQLLRPRAVELIPIN
jgi:toxin-antitoxin system PIN domain toxin